MFQSPLSEKFRCFGLDPPIQLCDIYGRHQRKGEVQAFKPCRKEVHLKHVNCQTFLSPCSFFVSFLAYCIPVVLFLLEIHSHLCSWFTLPPCKRQSTSSIEPGTAPLHPSSGRRNPMEWSYTGRKTCLLNTTKFNKQYLKRKNTFSSKRFLGN